MLLDHSRHLKLDEWIFHLVTTYEDNNAAGEHKNLHMYFFSPR